MLYGQIVCLSFLADPN